MKRFIVNATVLLWAAVLTTPHLYAQVSAVPGEDIDIEGQRLAQTGMKFLTISMDPRAAALSNAVTAQEASSTSMFYNPAGMARLSSFAHVALGQVQWIGDMKYNGGSVALRPSNGRYGVVGVSVVAADYGDFLETIRMDNEQGYVRLGTYSPSAYAVGLGYARAITDRFSVGGNAKYVSQSLGRATMELDESNNPTRKDNTVSTVAVDFGVIYRTGFESLNFAFSARNFSSEVTYVERSFELPLIFRLGLSMDVLDLTELEQSTHSFVVSVDGQRPRDYHEQVKVGGEYTFMDLLSLRAGYIYPTDEQGLSLGTGLNTELQDVNLGFDYSYTRFGLFGAVNRLSVNFGF